MQKFRRTLADTFKRGIAALLCAVMTVGLIPAVAADPAIIGDAVASDTVSRVEAEVEAIPLREVPELREESV